MMVLHRAEKSLGSYVADKDQQGALAARGESPG